MRSRIVSKAHTSIIAVPLLMLALSSCATNSTAPGHSAPVSVGAGASARVDDMRATELLMSLDQSAVANIVFQNTTDLGNRSAAVVVGVVNRWLAGDTVRTVEGVDVGAAILAEITITSVTQAQNGVSLRPGDVIYVPTISPSMNPVEVAEVLPENLEVVAYLDNALTEEELRVSKAYTVEPGDKEAAGLPRWPLQSPQGFVVTNPDDPRIQLWPFLGAQAEGPLEDALPGGSLDGLTPEQRKLGI
ncbi:hypothetical protein [Microbacterium sp.]|uniref:hypothetical protein n=1 Tax=Microbacterium sp. TaxID=51671 RepID=UPI0039E5F422